MSGLLAIDELARSRPTLDAPSRVVAAWYELKAVVLRDIATSVAGSEHADLTACAERAQAHANALRTW